MTMGRWTASRAAPRTVGRGGGVGGGGLALRVRAPYLPRVLRVEKIEQPHQKVLRDVSLHHLGVGLVGDHEAQQKLVDVLQVRPRRLEHRLILIRVVLRMRRRVVRREPPEEVGRDHGGDFLEGALVEDALGGVDVVHDLEQVEPLDLLVARLVGLRKVHLLRAKPQLADEQSLALTRWRVLEGGQRLNLHSAARCGWRPRSRLGGTGAPHGPGGTRRRLGARPRCGRLAHGCGRRGAARLLLAAPLRVRGTTRCREGHSNARGSARSNMWLLKMRACTREQLRNNPCP